MNPIKILTLTGMLLALYLKGNAQTINWNAMENAKQILTAGIGLDYSLSYCLAYGYKLNTKIPLVLNAHFSIPSGENVLDDFKIRMGGQILLLNKPSFKGAVVMHGIYRSYETDLVRLQNFGCEIKGTFGYYKTKWFVAAEAGFDKAIVTHFKHSEEFREDIYAEVVDGWYEPSTGGNFVYGLQTGYSFKITDVTLSLGKVISQDFNTAPLVPFYLNIGFNYRLAYQ